MKRLLIGMILLSVTVASYAQLSPEMEAYIREFPQRASFNIHAYEFHPLKDTPAPKGFKPFYISHYGRHGSRSHSSDEPYVLLKNCLEAAAREGIITPSGDSLLACAKQMIQLHNGMDGRLTPRGAREHELLARRMFQRYPEVFRHGEVHAISSDVQRCLVSMAAFTSSLKSCKNDLTITWDCGAKFQRLVAGNSSKEIRKKALDIVHGPLTDITIDTLAVFARFFKDPVRGKEIAGKSKPFISAIFTLAQFAEAYDIEENRYKFLPWEVVETYYARHALNFYLAFCNSVPFGDKSLSGTKPLVNDIIRKADEAIAGASVAADLRFGHDIAFLLLCSYLGLENYGYPRLTAKEAYRNWNGVKLCPFATNLQIVFYRNRKGAVLVKFLANEEETLIPELEAYSGPYYRWVDVKNYIANKKTDHTMKKEEKPAQPKGFVLEHPAIDVADPIATAAWWCKNLGFTITLQKDDETHTTFIVDASGRVAIELYRAKTQPKAPDYANMDPLTLHFGFTSTDVDADIERLTKAGATLVSHDKFPGFDGAMMRDPSGIPIQFVKREKSVLLK